MERGVINNRQYALQIRDFSGIRYENITPTDIDGLIDFHNRLFVLMEFKHINAPDVYGQKLAIARVVDNIMSSGRRSVGIIAEHNTSGDIDCANCFVREVRVKFKWHNISKLKITVKKTVDFYRKKYLSDQGVVRPLHTATESH